MKNTMTTRLAALRRWLRPLWPWLRWGTAATLALLLVLRFPGEKATEPPAGRAPPSEGAVSTHPPPSPGLQEGLGFQAQGWGRVLGA